MCVFVFQPCLTSLHICELEPAAIQQELPKLETAEVAAAAREVTGTTTTEEVLVEGEQLEGLSLCPAMEAAAMDRVWVPVVVGMEEEEHHLPLPPAGRK